MTPEQREKARLLLPKLEADIARLTAELDEKTIIREACRYALNGHAPAPTPTMSELVERVVAADVREEKKITLAGRIIRLLEEHPRGLSMPTIANTIGAIRGSVQTALYALKKREKVISEGNTRATIWRLAGTSDPTLPLKEPLSAAKVAPKRDKVPAEIRDKAVEDRLDKGPATEYELEAIMPDLGDGKSAFYHLSFVLQRLEKRGRIKKTPTGVYQRV